MKKVAAFNLETETLDRINQESVRRNISKSEVVQLACNKYLNRWYKK